MPRGRNPVRLLPLLIVALSLTAIDAAVAPSPAGASPGYPSVMDGDAPDPAVLRVGDTFYVYTTNTGIVEGNIPLYTSTDMVRWSFVSDTLPLLGLWAVKGMTWAPDVHEIGGRFVMYYAARDRQLGIHCLGRAESSSPRGPFLDRSVDPLVCPADQGGAIDPSVFRDLDGRLWLLYKTENSSIGGYSSVWSIELSSDGLRTIGAPNRLLTTDLPFESPHVEQPEMVYADGRHWLFYSSNWYLSDRYNTSWAACSGPIGPCTKLGAPWHTTTPYAVGPGAMSFTQDRAGDWFVTYHGISGPIRRLFVERVTFGADGPEIRTDLSRWASPTELDGSLVRLYSAYFLRSPDPAGIAYWDVRLNTDLSLALVSEHFARSPEFRDRYGSLDDHAFVDLVYRNVLGRGPDASGFEYWVGRLQQDLTRGRMMLLFSESPEYYDLSR